MSGLFVPLDVEYDSDDGFILAGPMAELLYVRGMAFCKRTGSDGHITHAQLAIVGRGIPSAAKQAQKLVDVDKWTPTATGWHVRAWLKRNKSVEAISADREMKKTASALANHQRWHVEQNKVSATCPLCHPKPDPKPDPGWDSIEVEPEVEPEGEGEGEGEGILLTSSHNSNGDIHRPAEEEPRIDQRHQAIADLYAAESLRRGGAAIRTPVPFMASEVRKALANEKLRTWAYDYPDAAPSAIAAWLHGDTQSMQYQRRRELEPDGEPCTVTHLPRGATA